jgi:hypothetical protein
MKFAAVYAGVAIILLLGLSMPAQAKKDQPAPICAPGQQICKGTYGRDCFTPSHGETCTNGHVCGVGESACTGRAGRNCYQPSKGETCTQGLVCRSVESACLRDGSARCYAPSRGETCP